MSEVCPKYIINLPLWERHEGNEFFLERAFLKALGRTSMPPGCLPDVYQLKHKFIEEVNMQNRRIDGSKKEADII